MEPQPSSDDTRPDRDNCWCIQIIPQIWHNWRRQSTEGLPGVMFFIWAFCNVPFGAYAIIQNFNVPIKVQPQALCFFAMICWGQTRYYGCKWSARKSAGATIGLGLLFGLLEWICVIVIRPVYLRGIAWPMYFIAIFSQILYVLGLIPPYVELWRRRGRVVGFSFVFFAIDIAGAFFSLLALAVQRHFDLLGGLCYVFVLIMEIGICTSHVVWLARTRRRRAAAAKLGLDIDDYVAAARTNPNMSARSPSNSAVPTQREETKIETQREMPEKEGRNPTLDLIEKPRPAMCK